eukprot:CAMPEP_0202862172 /NCGR_PEP_ID=MMETSP1391-20130828/3309_1 /ASSEMBLY_ACC=CAM_ASM_000867 /TAXON_ID=1034604 /ORGANISM="Chlamydomonas leiostraca, Strain SAG 11-49" /LENGTH=277 /DNA_ID=CAMNT_0049541669 /DNA_START=95 /DNA_END=928 /DNA_ORIENTATION=-
MQSLQMRCSIGIGSSRHPIARPCSRTSTVRVCAFQRNARRAKYDAEKSKERTSNCLVITVAADGSDAWRLEPVFELLRDGAVGIIPTDTLPALVAPLEDRDAVARLYGAKQLDPKKPLSILVRNFQDVAHYTGGFPAPQPGQPNWFNVMKKLLPGPYTVILPASKNLPSQCVDFMKGKNIHRKSVGVRLPDNPVTQAVLEGAGMALLCTSVHTEDGELSPGTEVPDVGSMLEQYAGKSVEFVVDIGPHVATQSSIIDMTGDEPEVIREGLGDVSPFL